MMMSTTHREQSHSLYYTHTLHISSLHICVYTNIHTEMSSIYVRMYTHFRTKSKYKKYTRSGGNSVGGAGLVIRGGGAYGV